MGVIRPAKREVIELAREREGGGVAEGEAEGTPPSKVPRRSIAGEAARSPVNCCLRKGEGWFSAKDEADVDGGVADEGWKTNEEG